MGFQGPVPPQSAMPQSPIPPQGPMPPGQSQRPRRIYLGPIILIAIGVFFLLANLLPSFDPWQAMLRYWPVILILIGVGKIWDYYAVGRYPGMPAGATSGVLIAVALLVFVLAVSTHRGWRSSATPRASGVTKTDVQNVELQGATAVTANLHLGAGELNMSGGSARLLDANFSHDELSSAPQLSYSVNAGRGQLSIDEGTYQSHLRDGNVQWDLHFNNTVPLDLNLNMGAGQSQLHLADVNLTHLEVHMGVGEMQLDLSGARKQDLSANIDGGVGQAQITLPRDVGVRVHASGGIGDINTDGLTKQGDEYVNAAYGKTPATIDLTVHGGIGEINIRQE